MHVCILAIFVLLFSTFKYVNVEVKANPSSELLFEENFDSLSVGETPHSFEWVTQSGKNFYNRSDCYFEVTNTVYNSTPNSLILNDTQGASSVYGLIHLDVDLFSYQDGKVQLFFRVASITTNPKVAFCQHESGRATAQFYFKDDGNITYYDKPTWKNMDTYTTDTWYNITTVFTASGVDYYVNEVKKVTACGFQNTYAINQIYILLTNPVTSYTNTVYIDSIKVEGEIVSQTFFQADSGKAWICTDEYRALIYTLTNSAYKGQIQRLAVKTTFDSWVNVVTKGSPNLFWSESWYPPAGGGTQVGIADIAGGTITVTDTTDTVEYYTTVQDSYFNFTNTITFFKDNPYIAFKIYRKMSFSDPDTGQKQVDFLFSPLEISKYYYTNATGVYSDINDFDGSVTVKLSSPNTYFPFYGYYFEQNYTVATIITYPYDTGGMLTEMLNTWNTYGNAYSEWEISFGQCASQEGTPTYQDQVEEVTGVLAIYQGDEGTTNSVQSLSESLFSDWSGNRTYLARLVDSENNLYVTSTGTLKSAIYTNDLLTSIINATSGQTTQTQVYCNDIGQPTHVTGGNVWSYDSSTGICTITTIHTSADTITLDWSSDAWAGGLFTLTVSVLKDGYPAHASICLNNQNTTIFGLTQLHLPYGSYTITTYCEGKTQTKQVGVYADTTIGFSYQTPPLPTDPWPIAIPLLIIVIAAIFFLFIKKR